MKVAYDARPLQPQTRHWGVGVVIDNLLKRLRPVVEFTGIAHPFPDAECEGIKTWHALPYMNTLTFEVSTLLVRDFDVYWGTNDFIPALNRRPSLLTVHDLLLLKYPEDQPHTRLLAKRFASSVKRADKVVADSKATADDLLAYFPDIGKKVEVGVLGFEIPTQLDPNAVSFDADDKSLPFVVMLGAHRPRKNLSLAIAAVAQARHYGRSLTLIVTGDIHPSFRDGIARASEFVKCAGTLPKEQMFNLLHGASALLFPSIYEGFGLPMLEAMSLGCPVLALDTPVNREVSGTAALLLPEDVKAWSEALGRIISEKNIAEEMKKRGFDNLRRFSWENTAKVYFDVFSDLVSKGNN